MKAKTFLFSTLAIGLLTASSAINVTICHNVDNNPVSITVALPAAVAHFIQHPSDTLGECGSAETEENNK